MCSIHHNMTNHCKDTETTQVPINRYMDKEDVVYIYNWISLSHEKYAHPLRWELSKAAACELQQGPAETKRGGARREKEVDV